MWGGLSAIWNVISSDVMFNVYAGTWYGKGNPVMLPYESHRSFLHVEGNVPLSTVIECECVPETNALSFKKYREYC
jgi:hypothetical protein